MDEIKIGHGYDVHRLCENRKLIIGGVDIPFDLGLLGHSDADVLTHAILDAIIGALGLGDIGLHFPDTDEKYRGISSITLAENVRELMLREGFSIGNIDATIVAQKPKMAAYIPTMKENLSHALGTAPEALNIKATTEEGLGFTGTGEGIAAHAVCILKKNITDKAVP